MRARDLAREYNACLASTQPWVSSLTLKTVQASRHSADKVAKAPRLMCIHRSGEQSPSLCPTVAVLIILPSLQSPPHPIMQLSYLSGLSTMYSLGGKDESL